MPCNKKKIVFISGSAYEYGRFGSAGKFLVRDLSRALIKNDFKIVTGYGLGIGPHVVAGALEEIYSKKDEQVSDHLQIFPFPSAPYSENISASYRCDMIAHADIVLFIFGNKLHDISIREADGLLKEFEIARSYKKILIPIGASGYASEKLWKRVVRDYDDYFETRGKYDLYEQLGDSSIDPVTLIDLVIQAAN
jgi:hypothetical protein